MSRKFFVPLLFLICAFSSVVFSQKAKRESSAHEKEVRDMIAFLQYMLNTIGDAGTPSRDKDEMVTESYKKIFRDAKVQIQDDLDENRTVITSKDVPAYLKDVDFFYKDVKFEFNIEKIEESATADGKLFYKVTLTRNLKGTSVEGKPVNNTSPRFIEINYDPKEQDLKIVSIYTRPYDQKKALLGWWNNLSYEWKEIFKGRFSFDDSVNIDQLKQITAIDSVDLSNNRFIINLEPLTQLLDLKQLNLANTHVTDLSPLRNLTELTDLDVSNTLVSDISALRYCLKLEKLNMANSTVTDISVFEKLTALREVDMAGDNINDFSPLENINSAKILNLRSSGIHDLTVMDSLTELNELDLSGNAIQDVNGLRELKQLTLLKLDSTQVNDLSPLASLINLRILSINNTQINNFDALHELTNLEKIYCDVSGVTQQTANAFMSKHPNVLVIYDSKDLRSWWQDLSPVWKDVLGRTAKIQFTPTNEELAQVTNLDSINIANYAGIRSLEPLRKLTKIRVAILNHTGVQNLLPLLDHQLIEFLNISSTSVSDLGPVSNLSRLKILVADKTHIQQIDTLNRLPNLNILYIDNTAVKETDVIRFREKHTNCLIVYKTHQLENWWNALSAEWQSIFRTHMKLDIPPTREQLHSLISLSRLQFHDTQISDLSPLRELASLNVLEFSGTTAHDLSALSVLRCLKTLTIHGNPIKDLAAIRGLENLKELDISNTPIEDLEIVASLKQLEKLDCSGTQVRKLNDLKSLNALTYLDCSNTDVHNLSPIESAPLKTLKCYNTRISKSEIRKFSKSHPDCNIVHY